MAHNRCVQGVALLLATGAVLLGGSPGEASGQGAPGERAAEIVERGARAVQRFEPGSAASVSASAMSAGVKVIGEADDGIGLGTVDVDDQGRIVAGGGAGIDEFDAVLVRLQPDGSIDPSFGDQGIVLRRIRDTAWIMDLEIAPDGRIVVAGYTMRYRDPGFRSDIFVARFLSDGQPDPSFGSNGLVITRLGPRPRHGTQATVLELQPDGAILVGGEKGDIRRRTKAILLRYRANGSPDRGFGRRGRVVTGFPGSARVRDLMLGPGGEITIAGDSIKAERPLFRPPDNPHLLVLARYRADGSIERRFGRRGTVVRRFSRRGPLMSVGFQPDGKVLAAGKRWCARKRCNRRFVVARFRPGGRRDATFGNRRGERRWPARTMGNVSRILTLPDQRIVLVGAIGRGWYTPVSYPAEWDSGLVGLEPAGGLDSGFGNQGRVREDLSPRVDEYWDATLDSTGRIVAAGYLTRGPFGIEDWYGTVARYSDAGVLEGGFGSGP